MMYRYPKEGIIAGVCLSLAKHSGVSPWLIRGLVLLILLAGGYILIPLMYIAAVLLMEKAPEDYYQLSSEKSSFFTQQGWQTSSPLRIKIIQYQQQLNQLKQRTAQLEQYVKSTTFHKNW